MKRAEVVMNLEKPSQCQYRISNSSITYITGGNSLCMYWFNNRDFGLLRTCLLDDTFPTNCPLEDVK